MLGDSSFRVLFQVLGYLYPGYVCYKDVVQKKPANNDRLRLWGKYWVLMAAFTAVQPITDTFLFFIPLYYSAKLAFACYLWANNLAGAELVFDRYVQPYVSHYEPALDGKLAEAKAFAVSRGAEYWQAAKQWVAAQFVNAVAQTAQAAQQTLRADQAGQAAPAAERGYSFHSASSGSLGGSGRLPSGLSLRSFSSKGE